MIESRLFDRKWLLLIVSALWTYYTVDGIKKGKIALAMRNVKRDEKPIIFWVAVVFNFMIAAGAALGVVPWHEL